MDMIIESVGKLEALLEHSGCDAGSVRLDVDPGITNCRYEKGACMIAEFGGKQGIFATFDPIRCCTRISFMFGAPLDTPQVRGAACAIINVATGFFCLARTLRPCPASSHSECGARLAEELAGKRIYIQDSLGSFDSLRGLDIVNDPASADIILISGDGLVAPGTGDLLERYVGSKRILCIGPSTAGTARLNDIEHWCPFGTG